MDPFSFQNLLNSQQPNASFSYVSSQIPSVSLSASDASVYGSQRAEDGHDDAEAVSVRKSRRKWSPNEDVVLISAWLNTSKDCVVGNDQKADSFWKRIAAYYNASPKVAGSEKREGKNCKSRWGKINEGVCRFVGCYEAASKQKSSGQNEDDVLKMSHAIYYNDYKAKFTMEHAWLELRHDQKWCAPSKKRKTSEPGCVGEAEAMPRPIGVKAAKAKGKGKSKASAEEVKLDAEVQGAWELRQKDFALKNKLNNQKLLDHLLSKTEPLTELEEGFKIKLITELMSS